MTVQGAQQAGAAEAGDAIRDWQALRDSGDIQFAPLPPIKPPEVPGWLETLGRFLRDLFEPVGRAIGMSWPVLQNVLIALGIVLVLALAWFLVVKPLLDKARARKSAQAEEDWTPDREAALALLGDADRLAEQGRYEEAVHLLLQRSVGQIAQSRPDWLHPASTAREIAVLPMLPESARHAFALIATRVERSLFALRSLDRSDWQAARTAYADFALADLSRLEPAT